MFVPLCNAPGESFGTITLTTALTYSVNTVFAQIGQSLGPNLMAEYMRRFGFFSLPLLDYPSNEMNVSGRYVNGREIEPPTKAMDVARVAIGQERLAVTPFQMAEVAATIANGGERMQPTLVDRVLAPDGSTVETTHPQPVQRVGSRPSTRSS